MISVGFVKTMLSHKGRIIWYCSPILQLMWRMVMLLVSSCVSGVAFLLYRACAGKGLRSVGKKAQELLVYT